MEFIDFARIFIDVVGISTTIFAILIFTWGIISWVIGAYPVFYRIGFGVGLDWLLVGAGPTSAEACKWT